MKLSHLLSIIAAATLAACGNLSSVSDEGTSDNLVWPQLDKSKFNHDGSQYGSWPNWDNVRTIERGMNKTQIDNLVGPPHFSEGLYGVREWDYVFNYRENDTHKICQYKILFDKDMNAQSFYWYPNGCNSTAGFTLNADFLFDFDKDTLTPKGEEIVDNVAMQLKKTGVKDVRIEGHTDRLGSNAYNLDLSQRRSNTVKERLIERGVDANFTAIGLGKKHQVVSCKGESGDILKECLRPNRRVIITAQATLDKPDEAGPIGPSPLYQ